VVRTRVGYAGGTTPRPTYQDIGDHSESIEIEFDPARIGFADLLAVFWEEHEPCERSFARQYAASVFFLDEGQRRLALASRDRVAAERGCAVATAVVPAGAFAPAEDYHQKYYLRGERGLMADLQARYPEDEALVASTAAARINGYLGGHGTPEQLAAEIGGLGLSARSRAQLQALVAERHPGASCALPGARRP
jgi:peptide-methionine (S)-S-oxide reductase